MPSFASSVLQAVRRVLGKPPQFRGPHAGMDTTLDGHTAVTLTEATITEGAGLGASFSANTAELSSLLEQQRLGMNLLGKALISHAAPGARGALAEATGLALSGCRVAVFLSGPDLAGAEDLLISAARRHLPLVLHLSNHALAAQSTALGTGHETLYLTADTGCFVLFAATVQEAVDFTLVARRVAEQTLTPGLVVLDARETALAAQDVRLPSIALVDRFLGAPHDLVPASTPAHRLLFGEYRRRVPRWHDPDRPVALGAMQPVTSVGLGRVADQLFLNSRQDLDAVLEESLHELAEHTGRRHAPISAHRLEDAEVILLAQGAAIETAEAVADRVRADTKHKVGVLGLRLLRPFPGGQITAQVKRSQRVWVLEQLEHPLAGDPPLLRELRASLERGFENGRFDASVHPAYPALRESNRPRLLSAIYGLGGLPLRGGDLFQLCTQTHEIEDTRIYLGIDLTRTESLYPKRQVLLDSLRRSYPDIARLGLASGVTPTDLRPQGALTLAVHRITGQDRGKGLGSEAGALLRRLVGGQLRSRPEMFEAPWGNYCIDLITSAPEGLRDPGDQVPVDLIVLAAAPNAAPRDALADLPGGILLMAQADTESALPADLLQNWRENRTIVYGLADAALVPPAPAFPGEENNDYLLGAVFGVLLDTGLVDVKVRRLSAARADALKHLAKDVRTARSDNFNAGIEAICKLDLQTLNAAFEARDLDTNAAPMVVRKGDKIDAAYDSLPRFWHQVGVLYQQGEAAELTPDPYAAIAAIPPWTSAFRDLSPLRTGLPVLDPLACTGCGACWSRCPDGAIGAASVSPSDLINQAIQAADASVLRPLVAKLAPRVATLCSEQIERSFTAGELLAEAFAWMQTKASLPKQRWQVMAAAVEALRTQLDPLPIAVTEPFFEQPESRTKGSGELLLLAIDPNGCKGCGICVSSCQPKALSLVEQTSERLANARAIWRAWEQVPDSKGSTLASAATLPQVDATAAMLLSRHTARVLVGGDGAEPGCGERLAVRLALAGLEAQQRPLVDALLEEVRPLADAIGRLIRETLADALPADDLDVLARGLETVDTRHTRLDSILAETQQSVGGGIDAVRMRRLVGLAQRLRELIEQLAEGRHGFGRACAGVVLASDPVSRWSVVYPHNPFGTPATLDLTGDGASLAAGLLQGQLRQATEGFILLRKARLELESAADAARLGASLDALAWRDLTPQEKALGPALLLIGGSRDLGRRGFSQVEWLLATELPIKLLLLADLNLGLATRVGLEAHRAPEADSDTELALLALARRSAYVAQSSLAAPKHLMQSLHGAYAYPGPALLHLHAPSPARHGFAPDHTIEQARHALHARVLPLFIYDPEEDGVFGSRLNLGGNPDPLTDWVDDGREDPPNPASWALSETRFCAYFSPLTEAMTGAIPLTEYLALDQATRACKTPVITAAQDNGSTERLALDARLVKACEDRLERWRVLQELAGLVTPFTARIKQEAVDSVAAAHAAALATLRAEYEARIAGLRQQMLADTRLEVRGRLMALAGYATGNANKDHTADTPAVRETADEV